MTKKQLKLLRAQTDKKYRDNPKHKIKILARAKTRKEISEGRIKKMPCAFCGNPKSEAHHKSYKRYKNIIWLCRKHHEAIHHKKIIEVEIW